MKIDGRGLANQGLEGPGKIAVVGKANLCRDPADGQTAVRKTAEGPQQTVAAQIAGKAAAELTAKLVAEGRLLHTQRPAGGGGGNFFGIMCRQIPGDLRQEGQITLPQSVRRSTDQMTGKQRGKQGKGSRCGLTFALRRGNVQRVAERFQQPEQLCRFRVLRRKEGPQAALPRHQLMDAGVDAGMDIGQQFRQPGKAAEKRDTIRAAPAAVEGKGVGNGNTARREAQLGFLQPQRQAPGGDEKNLQLRMAVGQEAASGRNGGRRTGARLPVDGKPESRAFGIFKIVQLCASFFSKL